MHSFLFASDSTKIQAYAFRVNGLICVLYEDQPNFKKCAFTFLGFVLNRNLQLKLFERLPFVFSQSNYEFALICNRKQTTVYDCLTLPHCFFIIINIFWLEKVITD